MAFLAGCCLEGPASGSRGHDPDLYNRPSSDSIEIDKRRTGDDVGGDPGNDYRIRAYLDPQPLTQSMPGLTFD